MTTRADVARLAGVSESTVSYALNGKRSISRATRERVLKAVEALDYQPHFAAGVLAGGKSKSIALSFGDVGISSGALAYVNGAERAATERGYHLVLWPNGDEAINEIKGLVKSGLLAGALLMETKLDDKRVEVLVHEKIPFVMIGRTADNRRLNYADRDFDAAADIGINYLHEIGHRHVAYINTARGRGVSELSVDVRFHETVAAKITQYGMTGHEILAANDPAAGREAMLELINNYPEVTSVIGLSDISTIGFLSAATEFGIKIPEDLSVISLSTPSTQITLTWPPLTTVSVPADLMGRDAVNGLIDRLDGISTGPYQNLYGGELEIRGTTSKPRTHKLAPNM
jgi:DNA-binding LacI/PurR family transcriptional regulator